MRLTRLTKNTKPPVPQALGDGEGHPLLQCSKPTGQQAKKLTPWDQLAEPNRQLESGNPSNWDYPDGEVTTGYQILHRDKRKLEKS